jgi:hypothetical protein
MMKDDKGMMENGTKDSKGMMKDGKGMMKESKDAMSKDKMKAEKTGKAMADDKMKMENGREEKVSTQRSTGASHRLRLRTHHRCFEPSLFLGI